MNVYYIVGPYSAKDQTEIDKHVGIAAEIAQMVWRSGNACICPHMNTYSMSGNQAIESGPLCLKGKETDWEQAFGLFLSGDLEIISRCDGIILLVGWEKSKGSCAEFAYARWAGIPIYHWPYDIPENVIKHELRMLRGGSDAPGLPPIV